MESVVRVSDATPGGKPAQQKKPEALAPLARFLETTLDDDDDVSDCSDDVIVPEPMALAEVRRAPVDVVASAPAAKEATSSGKQGNYFYRYFLRTNFFGQLLPIVLFRVSHDSTARRALSSPGLIVDVIVCESSAREIGRDVSASDRAPHKCHARNWFRRC